MGGGRFGFKEGKKINRIKKNSKKETKSSAFSQGFKISGLSVDFLFKQNNRLRSQIKLIPLQHPIVVIPCKDITLIEPTLDINIKHVQNIQQESFNLRSNKFFTYGTPPL